MAISFARYVDVTSGLLPPGVATAREFMLREATQNELTPTQTVLTFSSSDAVGTYYGTTSTEYLHSVFYFGYSRPVLLTSPSTISFAYWAETAVPPKIFGASVDSLLADFVGITDGAFILTLGSQTIEIPDLDFSSATSLADVATVIEAGIQAADLLPVWASASVVYAATSSSFDLVGGSTGTLAVAVATPTSGTNIVSLIGWGVDAIFSYGADEQNVTEFLIDTTAISDNYGSITFIPDLTIAQVTAAATWISGRNFQFLYSSRVLAENAAEYTAALSSYIGHSLTLYDDELTTEYPWLLPPAIFASTNYDAQGTVANYMFKHNGSTPLVTTDANADLYDGLRVNYVGQTQKNGSQIEFYQRGLLNGLEDGATIGLGVYTNEVWLKDQIDVLLINLLIGTESLPANPVGLAKTLATIQSAIDLALFNGVISVGNVFSTEKKSAITAITNDANAYIKIETEGYWLNAFVIEETPENFEIEYLLVYGKNNSVRKITGRNALA